MVQYNHCSSRMLRRMMNSYHHSYSSKFRLYPGVVLRLFGSSAVRKEQQKPALLNASAWLDSQRYCIQKNMSISGSDASSRLHQGRLQLRKELLSLSGPFILKGHGVPNPLLQDHIDLAYSLLQHYDNHETDRDNTKIDNKNNNKIKTVVPPSVSFSNSNGLLSFQRIRIRNSKGDSTVVQWTDDTLLLSDNRIQLCLTVMNRIATRLALLVLYGCDNIPLLYTTTGPSSIQPNSWNIEFTTAKTTTTTHHKMNNNTKMTVQISKQTNPNSMNNECHIRIHLHGTPSSKKEASINIFFDSYLDDKNNATKN